MKTIKDDEERILSRAEVLRLLGVGGSTLWRMEREGRWPAARQVSKSRVGYLQSEVMRALRSFPRAGGCDG